MSGDPFRRLGLPDAASADEVRRARRELAKRAHPDVGGTADVMREINDAAAAALRRIAERSQPFGTTDRLDRRRAQDAADPSADRSSTEWDRSRRDAPSFTVEALPVETFEALLLAAAALGEVEDDEPPYGLDVLMSPPLDCWCRLSVVPDAGASTVSLAVAAAEQAPPPIEVVRDAWIAELNSLDWSALD